MLRTLAAALLLAALGTAASVPAQARMHAPYRGHRIVPAATAPLDGFTQPAAAYSFRRLRTAYAGPAMRIQRVSDNAQLVVGFLGFVPGLGAPYDVAAAAAHCAATSCFIETWYDQSGNGRDAVRSGGVTSLIFDCIGTLPCGRSTDATQYSIVPNAAWAGKSALSAVANRTAGTGECDFITKHLQHLSASPAVANQWKIADYTGGQIMPAATDNVWHAASGDFDAGAGISVARIDGTETTGNLAGVGGTGPILVGRGATATTCQVVEAIVWDNYFLTPPERAALQTNQKSFWGTP